MMTEPTGDDEAAGKTTMVTAATGALGPVLAKLRSLLSKAKGADAVDGTTSRQADVVEFLISELKPVHSLLLRLWGREDLDAACKDWAAEARRLSYDMDDDISRFFSLLDGSSESSEHDGGEGTTGAGLLERIKEQVQGLVGRRREEEWVALQGQTATTSSSGGGEEQPPMVDPRCRFLHKDASELVEMEEKKGKLTRWLLLEEHEVVCIHGPAGMGKTTLADLVYQEIRDQFWCSAFVSVSPRPNMARILTSIHTQLSSDDLRTPSSSSWVDADDMRQEEDGSPHQLPDDADVSEERNLVDATSKFLAGRRYLIIVDDVWHWEQWQVIRECLPKNNNLGSRIIITTRINSVAEKLRTDSQAFVYKIGGLSMNAAEALSERIFKKSCKVDTVLSDKMHNTCSSIAKMSGGMPLAVFCMSEAVAEQLKLTEGQEDHFRVAESQALEGFTTIPSLKPLVDSLSLGYDSLPLHLKTCLLHCSIYPPYHIWQLDNLARMWVAEGFVHGQEEGRSYVNEIVDMGLICQCSSDKARAPLKYEMNVMMLHFLRCKSSEDYVVASVDSGSDVSFLDRGPMRRLSIQNHQKKQDTSSTLQVSDTRSLYVFDHTWRAPMKQFHRLRVLHLHGSHLGNTDLAEICDELLWLRCLSVKGSLINQLPTKIGKLQHLIILNVSNTGILHVPSKIGELQRLKILDVSNTMVVELPSEISRLQDLETLDLRNSRVRELPREIGKLQGLETLDVSNTMIKELPMEIGELQHLKTLDASNTLVVELPSEIGRLQHLETLDLRNSRVQELPREIGKLQGLEKLDVSSTMIQELPMEIGELQRLKTLDASNTMVVELPIQIGKLEGLVTLDVSNTTIEKLPMEIGELLHLVTLDVSGTMIAEVPLGEICKLMQLKTLDVSKTTAAKLLPKEICALQRLKTLNICGGTGVREREQHWGGGLHWELTVIMDAEDLQVLHLYSSNLNNAHLVDICVCDLHLLNCLNLKGALINLLPKQIRRLKGLKALNVSNTGVLHVPVEIGELQRLEMLDVSNTMVTEIPAEIGNLQHLKSLNLRNSCLQHLPSEIGDVQDLETLDVSNTMIVELPEEIRNLKQLKILNICNTEVSELPSGISDVSGLETLDVSNTMVVKLPEKIGNLQKLKTLNICNTEIKEIPWTAALPLSWDRVIAGDHVSPTVVKMPKGIGYRRESTLQLSIVLVDRFGSRFEPLQFARLKVGSRHMSVPALDKIRGISSMEISLWKLEEQDLKVLQEMPNLQILALRIEVLPRKAMSVAGKGFLKLERLYIDCRAPRVTFEKGAMPELKYLEFRFYACRPNEDPMGIAHLQSLRMVVFRSASWYRSDAPGIKAVIGKVRKEAEKHSNQITISINDHDEVVLLEKKGDGSSGADAIKPNPASDDKNEEASDQVNMTSASCNRTYEIQEVHDQPDITHVYLS